MGIRLRLPRLTDKVTVMVLQMTMKYSMGRFNRQQPSEEVLRSPTCPRNYPVAAGLVLMHEDDEGCFFFLLR